MPCEFPKKTWKKIGRSLHCQSIPPTPTECVAISECPFTGGLLGCWEALPPLPQAAALHCHHVSTVTTCEKGKRGEILGHLDSECCCLEASGIAATHSFVLAFWALSSHFAQSFCVYLWGKRSHPIQPCLSIFSAADRGGWECVLCGWMCCKRVGLLPKFFTIRE
jgi:hypothetical protein